MSDMELNKDSENFRSFARDMITKFPNTPLVALASASKRHYGPFANGVDAMSWYSEQPQQVFMAFIPLRNPRITREPYDFYSDDSENTDKEFVHDTVIHNVTV
jgi:hypothetical protein